MSKIVTESRQQHHCNVGWELRPLPDDHHAREEGFTTYLVSVGDHDLPGTVRRCECGKTWVGYRERYMEGKRGLHIVGTQWRPEGWFGRRCRERRERRSAG